MANVNQLCKYKHCLLINLLLKSSLRISTLLKLWFIPLRFLRRSNSFNRTRIDINTTWLSNFLCIHFLGFNDEDSIRKRFLALSSREFVREDFNFNTKDTLTEEDVAGSGIDKVAGLHVRKRPR